MDGDGGGIDGGDISGGAMGSTHEGGMESTGEDSPDSREGALQLMGYRDSEAGRDNPEGLSTDSWTSDLQMVIILAIVGFLGACFVYFLITGILAIFGVQL